MADVATLRRKVFAACRDLGIDDELRRDIQLDACGRSSMRDMTERDFQLVLGALERRGFKPAKSGKRPAAPRSDLRYVHVLWRLLGEAGELDRPDRAGLNAFVQKRFGEAWGSVPADIDMLRDHQQIATVIEALKTWCHRVGVNPEP